MPIRWIRSRPLCWHLQKHIQIHTRRYMQMHIKTNTQTYKSTHMQVYKMHAFQYLFIYVFGWVGSLIENTWPRLYRVELRLETWGYESKLYPRNGIFDNHFEHFCYLHFLSQNKFPFKSLDFYRGTDKNIFIFSSIIWKVADLLHSFGTYV